MNDSQIKAAMNHEKLVYERKINILVEHTHWYYTDDKIQSPKTETFNIYRQK